MNYPQVRVGNRYAYGKGDEECSFTISDFYKKAKLEKEWEGFESTTFSPAHFIDSIDAFPFENRPLSEQQFPPYYEPYCQTLIDDIQAGKLEKAILTSHFDIEFEKPIDPVALLNQLPTKGATPFMYRIAPHKALIGVTPEKLYSRRGNTLYSEALAGTSTDPNELLSSQKLRNEFQYVVDALDDNFLKLCKTHAKSELKIKQANHLYHLHVEFEGTLKINISDSIIIETLHPTPAMGGFPRENALRWLSQHELIERGFFTSYFGFHSKDEADILIAIRCALVDGNLLRTYAGGGIVRESIPSEELQELKHKTSMWRFS